MEGGRLAEPNPRPGTAPVRDLPRSIGFWGTVAIMVGIIIGGGIFAAPSAIAKELGHPGLILGFWALGGLIALAGGLTYAELATMFPQSGGVYVFLREAYGRSVAFIFGWSYLLITKPLGAAGIAIIFAEHFVQLLGLRAEDPALHQDPRVYTIALLALLTWINARGMRVGAGVALGLTSVKFLVLLLIAAAALALMKGDGANLRPEAAPKPLLLAIIPVMSAVLWTYDGWSDAGAVAGEIRDPSRSLPRTFFAGIAAVMGVYLLVNAVFLWMIPLADLREGGDAAPLVMRRLLGSGGETAVLVMVLLSTLGSTHGSIITGARVSYQQARDGLLPSWLGHVHARHSTPAVSLWVQFAMSALCVWHLGSFESLAGGFIFTMWIFYGLAGGALFVLRVRRPGAERPYRCWGYPVVPGLFVASAASMTALAIYTNVQGSEAAIPGTLVWLGVLALGFPLYAVWTRTAGRGPRRL